MRRLLAAALIVTSLAACGPGGEPACGEDVTLVDDPANPLMSPALMAERPDPRRDELVSTAEAWPDPFGEVLAGVNYNYDQWLHLYGVTGGALALTKRNAPVTFLSAESMEPVWALRPATKRIAWDASADRFLLLSLPADKPIEVQSLTLADARPRWCTRLESVFEEGDPLSTTILEGGDTVVAAKSGTNAEVVRLDGATGKVAWRTNLPAVDRADHVGVLEDQVVVGGREDHHLASGQYPAPNTASLTGVSAESGEFIWRYEPDDGATVHVVGTAGARLVLLERGERTRLVGLRSNGRIAWSHRVPDTALQSALRGGVVLLKSKTHYLGYDGSTGKRLWQWRIPTDRTFTPYGFTLGQLPAVDGRHVLMPTTTELLLFDVLSGKAARRLPMPTDGVSTTFWPYQLIATDRIFGVVTNTGAVVVRRTG